MCSQKSVGTSALSPLLLSWIVWCWIVWSVLPVSDLLVVMQCAIVGLVCLGWLVIYECFLVCIVWYALIWVATAGLLCHGWLVWLVRHLRCVEILLVMYECFLSSTSADFCDILVDPAVVILQWSFWKNLQKICLENIILLMIIFFNTNSE